MASSYSTHLSNLSPILGFLGWWFVPGYLSGLVLGIFYWLFPSWRPSMPAPPSTTSEQKPIFNPVYELQKLEHDRRSRHHRSLAHGLVISVYLGYTLMSTYQEQGGTNYYAVLGLKSNSLAFTAPVPGSTNPTPVQAKPPKSDLLDEAGLKSHWRKLARSFHPDKLNPPQNLQTDEDITLWKSEVESKFIQMREAYETLSDGTKQWAYDRFGPTIGQWKNCITMREYLLEGLKSSSPFYIFTIGSLSLIGSVRKIDPGTFWRWSILMCIVTAEAIVLTSTSTTAITLLMSVLFPNRAPFEQIELLRKLFIAGSCVATQLSGILYPIPPELSKKQTVGELIAPVMQLVEHTHQLSCLANVETVKLMFNDLHPIIKRASIGPSGAPSEKAALNHITPSNEQGSAPLAADTTELKKIIDDLKEKMLNTFCDLRLQSEPAGQAAWIQAMQPEPSSSSSSSSSS